jgi:glucose/arabinose dehydrogenase
VQACRIRTAAWALALCAAATPAAAQISLEKVAGQLARPTFVTAAPGDTSRLFFLEQHTGNVRIFDRVAGSVVADPFLTVPPVTQGGEQGLLGLAFHPDYANNGEFFVNRTDALGDTRIERYRVSASDPNRADPAPSLLLSIDQPQANHNGGWLGFGPDGYLYATSGDGGGSFDNQTGHSVGTGNSQDITDNLLGKVLRLDVDAEPAPGQGYAVPASNPFVGVEGDDAIWAYGLRNPWRASFDRETGDFYIGDVGQNFVEEIDFQPAASSGGENYGWRLREGTGATLTTVGGPKPPGAIDPIHEYFHGGNPAGRSVTGGYVYRGPIEELRGRYFFADAVIDKIWSITFDGSDPSEFDGANFTSFMDWTALLTPVGGFGTLSSFGEDAEGNLYLVDLGNPFVAGATGAIYRCVPEPSSGALLALGLAALRARRQTIAPRSRRAARRAAS